MKISDVEADCCRHSPAAAQGCASAGRLAALAALNGKLKLQKRQVNYQASTTHRGFRLGIFNFQQAAITKYSHHYNINNTLLGLF